jgi:hypothetical protein
VVGGGVDFDLLSFVPTPRIPNVVFPLLLGGEDTFVLISFLGFLGGLGGEVNLVVASLFLLSPVTIDAPSRKLSAV